MMNNINSQNKQFLYKNSGRNASFKGSLPVLNGLFRMQNSPAMSACAVDMCSMVLPRTFVETKNRGAQSGIETFIRESSSALINASIGLIGFASAALVSGRLNKKYGIKAQKIYASGDTIKNLSELHTAAKGSSEEFFKQFLNNLKGLNGTGWRSISKSKQQELAQQMVHLAEEEAKGADKSKIKSALALLNAQIIKETGAEKTFKLACASASSKEITAGISELTESALHLSNIFKKSSKNISEFASELMKNKSAAALLGLSICAALSVSVQPINRYLTKKRTGKDAFAGTDGEKDTSKEFKVLKTAAGLGFPLFAVSTIGVKPKDLPAALQFNGKLPRINQFKLIYGTTIASRLLFARDKDELRESLIKDTLGFSTWLIFGDFVSKITARAIGGKELINNPLKNNSKNCLKRAAGFLMNGSVKSFNEILLPETKDIVQNGAVKTFKDLYQQAAPELKNRVKKAAFAQAFGYLFSGVVLGAGIAKLNIFITNKIKERRNSEKQLDNINKTNYLNKNFYDVDYMIKAADKTSAVLKDFSIQPISSSAASEAVKR